MLRKKSAEEREQVLRELLKKKGNNRCVNCSAIVSNTMFTLETVLQVVIILSLIEIVQGPQYVITKYRVFVCTTCSGIQ